MDLREENTTYVVFSHPGLKYLSGPEGARTPDLLTASQTLYQLSYGPVCFSDFSIKNLLSQ